MAAAIRDFSGEVAATMSLSAVPTYWFERSKDRYRTTLLSTARKVSERLNYTGAKRLRQ